MKLIEEIYKNASMGADSVSNLLLCLEEKDNKIKKELGFIKQGYEEIMKKSQKLMKKKGESPKEENIMVKAMSKMNIKKEVIADNSDSAIADMVIQGMEMGNIEMEKQVKCCEDKDAIHLAKEFMAFSEDKIKELKSFL